MLAGEFFYYKTYRTNRCRNSQTFMYKRTLKKTVKYLCIKIMHKMFFHEETLSCPGKRRFCYSKQKKNAKEIYE